MSCMGSFPSIFNDVLGPVMRGPSSSHSAASLRIGRIARDLMGSEITHVTVDYDPNGSLEVLLLQFEYPTRMHFAGSRAFNCVLLRSEN